MNTGTTAPTGVVSSAELGGKLADRDAFERWIASSGARYWNTSDAAWSAWCAAVAEDREQTRALIADDARAATYQSLGQYRTALLRFLCRA